MQSLLQLVNTKSGARLNAHHSRPEGFYTRCTTTKTFWRKGRTTANRTNVSQSWGRLSFMSQTLSRFPVPQVKQGSVGFKRWDKRALLCCEDLSWSGLLQWQRLNTAATRGSRNRRLRCSTAARTLDTEDLMWNHEWNIDVVPGEKREEMLFMMIKHHKLSMCT